MDPLEPGIHLLHKPPGATSFSLVQPFISEAAARARKVPVCHGGALDPFAQGLLPILVGRATRLFELLHPIPKQYDARIKAQDDPRIADLLCEQTLTLNREGLGPICHFSHIGPRSKNGSWGLLTDGSQIRSVKWDGLMRGMQQPSH